MPSLRYQQTFIKRLLTFVYLCSMITAINRILCVPNTVTKRSGTVTKRSGTVTKRLGVVTKRLGMVTKRSGVVTKRSGMVTKRLGMVTKRSGTVTKRSGTVTKRSGMVTKRSGVVTKRSGTVTKRSGTVTKRSGVVLRSAMTESMTKNQNKQSPEEPSPAVVKINKYLFLISKSNISNSDLFKMRPTEEFLTFVKQRLIHCLSDRQTSFSGVVASI